VKPQGWKPGSVCTLPNHENTLCFCGLHRPEEAFFSFTTPMLRPTNIQLI
jgi:hypothetical protein